MSGHDCRLCVAIRVGLNKLHRVLLCYPMGDYLFYYNFHMQNLMKNPLYNIIFIWQKVCVACK